MVYLSRLRDEGTLNVARIPASVPHQIGIFPSILKLPDEMAGVIRWTGNASSMLLAHGGKSSGGFKLSAQRKARLSRSTSQQYKPPPPLSGPLGFFSFPAKLQLCLLRGDRNVFAPSCSEMVCHPSSKWSTRLFSLPFSAAYVGLR
jgi:hypothetical protein